MTHKVLSVKKSINGSGKEQLSGTLENQLIGVIPFLVWQKHFPAVLPKLRTGNIIQINEKSDYKGTMTLENVSVIKEARLGLDQDERGQVLLGIIAYLDLDVIDEKYKPIKDKIISLLKKNEAKLTAPAAISHHHNYVGGLLQHIDEVMIFASRIADFHELKTGLTVNRSLLLCACVLHDLGKINEYKIDAETGLIEYNTEWIDQWVSHTQWAFTWAMAQGYTELAHMVAAHHGFVEWGALSSTARDKINYVPKTIEENILFLADMSSSRLGKITAEMLGDLPQG